MKHTAFILIPALAATLLSCDKTDQLQRATEPPPLDSFLISGVDNPQQTNTITYLNDSVLCSYDLIEKRLVFFHKDQDRHYKAALKKEIDTEFWSMFFRASNGRNYFTDRSNTITEYNATADTLQKRYTISHRFPHLKDSFALARANNSPILITHDTLISVISPNSNESLRLYFKEQEIAEFRIDPASDTIRYLRSYITKPAHLSDYDFPMGMYAFHHNTVFLIYPQCDTIYSFNRSTNTLHKTAIHNQDFAQPAKFTCKAFTPEYGSCATKYYLHNFRYWGVYHNPLTKHFVLFYNAAVEPAKGHVPTFDDQPLRAIVLDEQLNLVGYHYFTKPLEAGTSFFMIPGKGLAMPILNETYETAHFYIYNL